jgi:hypothetical protein
MRTILALVSLLACLVSTTLATALTYQLEAHEKACYFAQVEHKGTKLAFYFAVRLGSRCTPVLVPGCISCLCACIFAIVLRFKDTLLTMVQVQSGGSFDIDYSVVGPTDKVILDGTKERQGDFVFTANDPGEYRFCFNNEMSTFAEKMVDFEIAVCCPCRLAGHRQAYCGT